MTRPPTTAVSRVDFRRHSATRSGASRCDRPRFVEPTHTENGERKGKIMKKLPSFYSILFYTMKCISRLTRHGGRSLADRQRNVMIRADMNEERNKYRMDEHLKYSCSKLTALRKFHSNKRVIFKLLRTKNSEH